MDIYSPSQLPIISSLASNFTTFNRWFCSVPTCTFPNKWFLYSASSAGRVYNPRANPLLEGLIKMGSIFDNLEAEGFTWGIHFMDWCDPAYIYPTVTHVRHFHWDDHYKKLYKKMQDGTLDQFTYLVAREAEIPAIHRYANDQHPS
jgi:phospholipase C